MALMLGKVEQPPQTTVLDGVPWKGSKLSIILCIGFTTGGRRGIMRTLGLSFALSLKDVLCCGVNQPF